MRRTTARLLPIALALSATLALGCTRTLGAPTGDAEYDAESNEEAMQDEEDREAWESINR
jgi:hypothetical protein